MSKEKAYVALPISGTNIQKTKERAKVAKAYLNDLGYDTKTPFDLVPKNIDKEISALELKLTAFHTLDQTKRITEKLNRLWATAMGYCLKYLVNCRLIYLLDGWPKSKGATIEGLTAYLFKIPTKYESNEQHTKLPAYRSTSLSKSN